MTDFIKQLRRTPEPIEAALVAEHTAEKIALWCGGSYGHERDRGVDSYLEVVVPNIEGNQKAHVNQYVVRKPNGRFYVMTQAEVIEAGYEEYGKRESGIDVDARLKAVVGDDFTLAQKFTPHYAARNSPFSNER